MNAKASTECGICQLKPPESYELLSTDLWRIRHSPETDILGYFVLEPRRHFLDLSEANSTELYQYGLLLSALMKAQREVFKCERVYTFSLAEAVPHYHLHVIPRCKDFPRAYKGRGIMSYPTQPGADANLIEAAVQSTKAHFRRKQTPELAKLAYSR